MAEIQGASRGHHEEVDSPKGQNHHRKREEGMNKATIASAWNWK